MRTLKGQRWRNWSHTVENKPDQIFYPTSLEELSTIVKEAKEYKKTIRVAGAGHSFTSLLKTNEWIISLDSLSGIESLNKEKSTVTVLGGTRLYTIGKELGKRGYSQENLGDINVQSIAGALSTGTHGTGLQFGNLSTQVIELTLLTANGECLTLSAYKQPHFFQASLVSLGCLGIIVKVTLKIIEAPIYIYQCKKVNYDQLIQKLDAYILNNRHFEFYLFPYSNTVQVKKMNETNQRPQGLKKQQLKNLILENYFFLLLSKICKWFPKSSRYISRLSAWGVGTASITSYSYRLFATPRLVRFREMEYCIPLFSLKIALEEVRAYMEQKGYHVHFPIECRTVKEDDIWLSPSYQRDSAYIAFHMYKGMPYHDYFRDMEEIMKKYEGRPHWGKLHNLSFKELQLLYPKFNDFLEVRKKLDPEGMFLNAYTKNLFGIME
ncbi:D-arabinono-1,4-lactone oxidase [Cytobacillus sp. Hz8]|uniref:D-arabinono-1,4-lactone oxidase n=1 Tax=Cytobacillus sp. Hz8 TaxID=3347168 RepID=UPI0035DB4286